MTGRWGVPPPDREQIRSRHLASRLEAREEINGAVLFQNGMMGVQPYAVEIQGYLIPLEELPVIGDEADIVTGCNLNRQMYGELAQARMPLEREHEYMPRSESITRMMTALPLTQQELATTHFFAAMHLLAAKVQNGILPNPHIYSDTMLDTRECARDILCEADSILVSRNYVLFNNRWVKTDLEAAEKYSR